jgi:site-specific recombinase XerD
VPHDLITIDAANTIPALLADDLDLAKLLVTEELAESTRAGYTRDVRLFAAWCDARGVCPMPSSPAIVASYVAHLVREGTIRGATLSRRIAAIAWCHKIAGEPDPTTSTGPTTRSAVRPLLRAARRRLGTETVNRKAAISPDMMVEMLALCPATLTGKRDRALLCLGWCAALRRSELTALNVEDVETVVGGVHVRVRKSKTDQLGVGASIGLPDRARDRIRPVRELKAWLRAGRIRSGAIFCRINKVGRLQGRLDSGSVGLIVKHYALLAGFDVESLGGHSLRIGFATSAAAAGATAAEMQAVTRHTDVNTLFTYIRSVNLVADYPAAILR